MAQYPRSRSRLAAPGLLAVGMTAMAIGVPTQAVAAPVPVPPALVTSSPAGGMIYTGSSASTITRVSLSGTTFTIDDNSPITAGAGCSPIAGDATQARCTAPKETNGTFKRFTVKAMSGNDTVFNVASVGMIADGGIGNDSLNGSVTGADKLTGSVDSDKLVGNGGNDTLSGGSGADLLDGGLGDDDLNGGSGDDILRGSAGDDDFFQGFLGGGRDGNDTIDGGAGLKDRVDYTNYVESDGAQVVINLFDDPGFSGVTGEQDLITGVEDADGSLSVRNIIFGNDRDNRLLGGTAADIILGEKGADFLVGGEGDDLISSNSLSLVEFVPLPTAPGTGSAAGRTPTPASPRPRTATSPPAARSRRSCTTSDCTSSRPPTTTAATPSR